MKKNLIALIFLFLLLALSPLTYAAVSEYGWMEFDSRRNITKIMTASAGEVGYMSFDSKTGTTKIYLDPLKTGGGIVTDTNCDQAIHYPIGASLCQDSVTAKLYKGVGAGVLELTAGSSGDMTAAQYVTSGKIKTAAGGTGIDSSASTGIPKITAGTWSANVAYTDITGLWTTCSGYLKSDGTCDTPSGGSGDVTAASNSQSWGNTVGPIVWTFGVTGVDPVWTVTGGSMDLTTGTLKQAGVPVEKVVDVRSYVSLQAAINAVSSGGEVFVPSGNYLITAALTNSASNVTIRGQGKTSKIYTETAGVPIFNISTCSNITIKDLYLFGTSDIGGSYTLQDGIKFTNVDNSTISNVIFEGFRAHGILLSAGCDDNLIERNTFTNIGDSAVRLNGTSNRNRILANSITNTGNGPVGGHGIVILDNTTSEQANNIISNNIIKTVGTTVYHHGIRVVHQAIGTLITHNEIEDIIGEGIELMNNGATKVPKRSIISENVIRNTGSYGIIATADEVIISKNTLYNTASSSPSLMAIAGNGNNCLVVDNIINGGGYGIQSNHNYSSISRNTIKNTVRHGIWMQGIASGTYSQYNIIEGNIVVDIGSSLGTAWYGYFEGDNSGTGASALGNIVRNNRFIQLTAASYDMNGIKIESGITGPTRIENNEFVGLDSNVLDQTNAAIIIQLGAPGRTAATLATPANGSMVYCSDCTIANPCAGAGTGALAKRLNGTWVCN